MNEVRKYYNEHVDDEDQRLIEHPFEIPVNIHFVKKYLRPGDLIFDVSCGTGRLANELLRMGFLLGLNDLSDKNIELVQKRFHDNPHVLFIERSEATESKGWVKEHWDSIFLLGPLYHLKSKESRIKLLKLAREYVKPGGYVFSSFMTRVGAMIFGIKNNPKGIVYPDGATKLWETGTDKRFVEETEWFTNAYFSHPEEINPLLEEAGLKPLHLAGVEGIFGERLELYSQLDLQIKDAWMDFVLNYCEDPQMVQNSKHILSVAQKPF